MINIKNLKMNSATGLNIIIMAQLIWKASD